MPIHTSTILARSPAALLAHLSALPRVYRDHSLFFALSPNVHPSDLSSIVQNLSTFSSQTAGCLSASLPGDATRDSISCSLAFFDKRRSTFFRSTIPGNSDPQVGRWHAFRKRHEDEDLTETPSVWTGAWGKAKSDTLPVQLRGLNPNEVNAVLYFSDRAPQGLASSLATLPNAIQLGLVATSTPFITGRPVTLFHNERIYDSGAIGIALTGRPMARSRVDFWGTAPLSPPMRVTRVEGNMINELDNVNPTQLLLSAIRESGIDLEFSGSVKDDKKFFLGLIRNGNLSQIYNITAGDPSRGNLSLDCQKAPFEGSIVQFFHRDHSTLSDIPKKLYQPHSGDTRLRTFSFMTAAETSSNRVGEVKSFVEGEKAQGAIRVLDDIFLASSENGFIMGGSGDESPWICSVPGALSSLDIPTA